MAWLRGVSYRSQQLSLLHTFSLKMHFLMARCTLCCFFYASYWIQHTTALCKYIIERNPFSTVQRMRYLWVFLSFDMKNIFKEGKEMGEGSMLWRFHQQSKNYFFTSLTLSSGSGTHAYYFTDTQSHALKPADWLWSTDVHSHINIPVRIHRNLALAMTHRETLDPTSVALYLLDGW